MEKVLEILKGAKTGEELDEGLGLLTSCSREEIDLYRHQCLEVFDELTKNENLMNAKLRRKLKRILQFILNETTTEPSSTLVEENSSIQEKKEITNPSSTSSSTVVTAIKECLQVLQECSNLTEIEESIIKLPVTEFLSRDQNVDRFILALERFLERSDIQINAKLRRRVKRLMETLTALPSSSGNGSSQVSRQSQGGDEDNIVVTVVKKVPIIQTLQLLNSVRSYQDLEYSLNSMELPDFQAIKSNPGGTKTT